EPDGGRGRHRLQGGAAEHPRLVPQGVVLQAQGLSLGRAERVVGSRLGVDQQGVLHGSLRSPARAIVSKTNRARARGQPYGIFSPISPILAISARKRADAGSAGFRCRPSTTTATRRAPASLRAAAVDWALPPDTHVSSTTRTSRPATGSSARTQYGLTPLVWISAGTTASRTRGQATHDRTSPASGCAPGRPWPLPPRPPPRWPGRTCTGAGPRRAARRAPRTRPARRRQRAARPLRSAPAHIGNTGQTRPRPAPGKYGRTRPDARHPHR